MSAFIVLLVVADMWLPPKWRGLLTGLAGAIKLTPMFFVAYFLITRQWRAAANTVGAFLAAGIVGFIVFPADSIRFWTVEIFATGRIPDMGSARNLSIMGSLLSWGTPDVLVKPLWLLGALVVGLLALLMARRHHLLGEETAAILVVGVASTMIGPVAWSHHLLWLPLCGVYMAVSGSRAAKVAGWSILAASSVFSPLWNMSLDPTPVRQAIGMFPVLVCLAISVLGLPRRAPAGPDVQEAGTVAVATG